MQLVKPEQNTKEENKPFWVKLRKTAEWQSICAIGLYEDSNGREYRVVENISRPIDRSKKKEEKEEQQDLTSTRREQENL